MKTAICVMIKDENDYLDEWLDYHLNLGIDEIYLYEDYDSKSHLDIVKPYGNKVHLNSINVIFEKNKKLMGINNQEKLFYWFPIEYKNIDWVLFIDVDEFLILKQPLQDLLEEYKNETAILLRWVWYGASGHINKPVGKVMDNFTKNVTTLYDYHWSFKSFLNCKNFKKWEKPIHKVEGGVYPLYDWGGHKAFIKHYFTKSWEEWKTKVLSRGDCSIGHRKVYDFFKLNPDMLHLKEQLMSEVTEIYKGEKKEKEV